MAATKNNAQVIEMAKPGMEAQGLRIVVISSEVPGITELKKAIKQNVGLVETDYEQDDIMDIYRKIVLISKGGKIASIAFVDHGTPANMHIVRGVRLNRTTWYWDTNNARTFIEAVCKLLATEGHLDLLTCDFSKEQCCRGDFMAKLESDTGTNFAASSTGFGPMNKKTDANLILESDGYDTQDMYFNEHIANWKHELRGRGGGGICYLAILCCVIALDDDFPIYVRILAGFCSLAVFALIIAGIIFWIIRKIEGGGGSDDFEYEYFFNVTGGF